MAYRARRAPAPQTNAPNAGTAMGLLRSCTRCIEGGQIVLTP